MVFWDIKYQSEDAISKLDQKKILLAARSMFKGIKGLAGAYIPSSRVVKATGEHLAGCPCAACLSLEHSLSKEDADIAQRIRTLRNWMPKDGKRQLCLLLPAAVPVVGDQPDLFAFTGMESFLLQLEKAFADGILLNSRLFGGRLVNTTKNLSSAWVGGENSSEQVIRGTPRLDPAYTIPRASKAVSFVRSGPKAWGRFEARQSCAKPSSYQASDEAMEAVKDLYALPKAVLDKRIMEWSQDNLSLPDRQYEQVRVPRFPAQFDKVAKTDAQSKLRENILMAVGAALNYAMVAGVRVSETVAQLDELVPNLELRLAAISSIHPPIYVSPGERKSYPEIKAAAPPEQLVLVDPDPSTNHTVTQYLRLT